MALTNYDQEMRLRQGGSPEWLAAVRRAGLIATYAPWYGQGTEEWEAVDLLALLLYWLGSTVGGADAVDLDTVLEVVAEVDHSLEDLHRPPMVAAEWAATVDKAEWQADQDARSAQLRADRRRRLERLDERLLSGLRQAGHDPDAPSTSLGEVDPVIAAWRLLTIEPAETLAAFSEYPASMHHPRGTTPLGRALATVHHWLRAQAGPHHDGGLRDVAATAWEPAGPRLHLHVPVNDAIRALAEVYASVLHAWRHLLRPVDPRFLHLTLAWCPIPTSDITDEQREQLHQAVRTELTTCEPGTLTVGRAVLTRHGVALDVSPDQPVHQLVVAMQSALHAVFGPGSLAYENSDWWPHIALAYAHTGGPAAGLAYDLTRCRDHRAGQIRGGHRPNPVQLPVTGLLVVDQDTYATNGLTWTHQHLVEPIVASTR